MGCLTSTFNGPDHEGHDTSVAQPVVSRHDILVQHSLMRMLNMATILQDVHLQSTQMEPKSCNLRAVETKSWKPRMNTREMKQHPKHQPTFALTTTATGTCASNAATYVPTAMPSGTCTELRISCQTWRCRQMHRR